MQNMSNVHEKCILKLLNFGNILLSIIIRTGWEKNRFYRTKSGKFAKKSLKEVDWKKVDCFLTLSAN